MSDPRFPHEIDVDDPVELSAVYQLDAADRRRVDGQILAIQQVLVDLLIRGHMGSWFQLDDGSAELSAGDVFVLAADNRGYVVTRATVETLAAAGIATGVALEAAGPGMNFRGVVLGAVPPSITGLTGPGMVWANPVTARCEVTETWNTYILGFANTDGVLHLTPSYPGPSILRTGYDTAITATSPNVPADPLENWMSLGSWALATDLLPDDDRIRSMAWELVVTDSTSGVVSPVIVRAAVRRDDAGTDEIYNLDDHTVGTTLDWTIPLFGAAGVLELRLQFFGDNLILYAHSHATADRTVRGQLYLGVINQ